MNILGIETSTTQASVAVSVAGHVTARGLAAGPGSSSQVLPELMALLRETGLSIEQIDLIAFGAGPGAFTGVRVACGVAQGLARGLGSGARGGAGVPVLPLCTLEAMAETALLRHGAQPGQRVLSVLDARMQEVYVARYQYRDNQWVEELPPCLLPAHDVPAASADTWVVGNGVPLCAGLSMAALQDASVMPEAAALVRLAVTRAALARPAREAAPLYLRNKVAFTTDEREQGLHRRAAPVVSLQAA